MTLTPPLKWHGGKHYLASKIVAMMPPHTHYVEPYAGGLAVLLARDGEGVSEVVNDLDAELMNFWSVLRDPQLFAAFHRAAEGTPFSEAMFDASIDPVVTRIALGVTERAFRFFIRCRQSLAGRMTSFAPLSRTRTRRGMNEQVSAWLGALEGLPAVHARLKRVVVLNRDALEVIRTQDGPATLFYLDPPYLDSTRTATDVYTHEMSREQHEKLLGTLASIRGKLLLSGYDSDLYRDAEARHGWTRVAFDLPNNSASGDTKQRRTEIVWRNFA